MIFFALLSARNTLAAAEPSRGKLCTFFLAGFQHQCADRTLGSRRIAMRDEYQQIDQAIAFEVIPVRAETDIRRVAKVWQTPAEDFFHGDWRKKTGQGHR